MQNVLDSAPGLSPAQHLLFRSELQSSKLYLCPLYLWAAQGRFIAPNGKVEQRFWLYVEYRDRYRRCRYSQFQFSSVEALNNFLDQELTETSLHEIHPEYTLASAIKQSDQMSS